MFALDPGLNIRLFTSGSHASAWAVQAPPGELGAWSAVFDGWRQLDTPREIAIAHTPRRTWISGSPAAIQGLAARCPASIGLELGAATRCFSQALLHPPRPLIMGVLNVTPDSFSDGGRWLDPALALEHGLRMVAEGADILDIGGESTRPGAAEISTEEELARVLPVVQALRPRTGAILSVDTRKAAVAAACLEAGADWINDISGLVFDPALADAVAAHPQSKLVLMHSRSRPAQEVYSTEWDAEGKPVYEDVVADTLRWLRVQAHRAMARKVKPEQLWIDPGFGFGKTYAQNVEILRRLREYTSAGLPLLVGTSRKSSVGKLQGDNAPAEDRLEGTAATVAWAVANGAACVRVHDVKEMKRVALAAHTLASPASVPD